MASVRAFSIYTLVGTIETDGLLGTAMLVEIWAFGEVVARRIMPERESSVPTARRSDSTR